MLKAPPLSPGKILRERIAKGPILLPGAFNAISALSAAKAGAEGIYLSGAGITNANLGVPDIALATLTEFAQQAKYVTNVSTVPVICDADTGFGEIHNVHRTVIEMEAAGLAGIHLEDQLSPKRCGHLDGKALISTEDMVAKLKAAIGAKRDVSFMVIARTDARGVEGLEGSIARAKAYADAGADAIFPEGLVSETEFETYRSQLNIPLLANMTEFGKTPLISFAEFSNLGYEMVIFPLTAFRVMLKALDDAYSELLTSGTQREMIDKMRTRKELYDLIDYPIYEEIDRRLGGTNPL